MRNLLAQMLGNDHRGRSPHKGRTPGHHVIERGAQRIDVGTNIDGVFATDLFRAHVVRRSQCDTGLRDGTVRLPGQAKIGDLDRAGLREHEVVGLDVTVDDAA